MDQSRKEKFEQSLSSAIKQSLEQHSADSSVHSRLLSRLNSAQDLRPAADIDSFKRFQDTYNARIVSALQSGYASDQCVLRLEEVLGKESDQDLLSQNSVRTASHSPDPRARFLEKLDLAVRQSIQSQKAPARCEANIRAALASEKTNSGPSEKAKITPIASSRRIIKTRFARTWKKGITAAASLAACAALIFITVMGSAQKALADSVRQDHVHCCMKLEGAEVQPCARLKDSSFGPVPSVIVGRDWKLISSGLCTADNGKTMVHNLYRDQQKTLSIHFIPPASGGESPTNDSPKEIAEGNFPVFAWCCQGWTVTACSEDLNASQLASAIGAKI